MSELSTLYNITTSVARPQTGLHAMVCAETMWKSCGNIFSESQELQLPDPGSGPRGDVRMGSVLIGLLYCRSEAGPTDASQDELICITFASF